MCPRAHASFSEPPSFLGLQAAPELTPSAQVVDFSDIFTGRLITEIPQSLRSLCTSLLNSANLTSLDLSDNAFGGRSVDPMHVPAPVLLFAACQDS